jgi:hypothetical protein
MRTGIITTYLGTAAPGLFVGLNSGSGLLDYFRFVGHERMLCADEAAQKEALTRDDHPGLTAGANLFRAYGAGSRGTQLSKLVFMTLCF